MKKIILDDEEKDILESYERGEWVPVKNAKKEIKKLQQYARNTLQKDKRINIRMSSKDLDQVQVIAVQEGIPYQTLVSSIIHKYRRQEMRTNVVINDNLMASALKVSGFRTKKDAIEEGLKLLVQMNSHKEIKRFRGKLKWSGNLNEMRTDK